MTNRDAIDILRKLEPPRTSKKHFDDFMQARDMAIEALSKPEIVRCKNCQRYEYGICKKAGLCVNKSPNGFCDWGERREVTT